MTIDLQPPVRLWKCPSCLLTDKTQRADVHTQMHPCPALGGVVIPLVEVRDLDDRPDARQVAVMREDNGLLGSIRTERGDGSNDVTVMAAPAVAKASAPHF